MTKSEETEDF